MSKEKTSTSGSAPVDRLACHRIVDRRGGFLTYGDRVMLSPPVESFLLGDLHLSERRIRALVATAEWEGHGI